MTPFLVVTPERVRNYVRLLDKRNNLDENSLPMRDINELNTHSQTLKSCIVNNRIYQNMSKEPQSTLEATKHLIQILDAKYEKADLRAIVNMIEASECPRSIIITTAPTRL